MLAVSSHTSIREGMKDRRIKRRKIWMREAGPESGEEGVNICGLLGKVRRGIVNWI